MGVYDGATLNVLGGETKYIDVYGSTLNMHNSRLLPEWVGGSNPRGIRLLGSQGTIVSSRIENVSAIALAVVQSNAYIKDSTLSTSDKGNKYIPTMTSYESSFFVEGSRIVNMAWSGVVIEVINSEVLFRGSDISTDGYIFKLGGFDQKHTFVTVQDTKLKAGRFAFLINTYTPEQSHSINILDGSQLLGGNLMYLNGPGTTHLVIGGSTIGSGSGYGAVIMLANDPSLQFTLRDGAIFKGRYEQYGGGASVIKMNIESRSTWQMERSESIKSLALDEGFVSLSDGTRSTRNTLTVESLSGSRGTFELTTNLGLLTSDQLKVTGTASGDFTLRVHNTGEEPKAPQPATLIETNGGTAVFSLYGSVVDVGLYQYRLQQQGNDWVLTPYQLTDQDSSPGTDGLTSTVLPHVPASRSLTASARTLISSHVATPQLLQGENRAIQEQLNDLRYGQARGGAWAKTFGRKSQGTADSDVNYNQDLWSMVLGYEGPIREAQIPLTLGVFGGYSQSEIGVDGPSKSQLKSAYVGLYGSLSDSSGLYFDGVFKVNRLFSDAQVTMSSGSKAHGKFQTDAISVLAEAGKRLELDKHWYAQPFVQLSAAHVIGYHQNLSNGMRARAESLDMAQASVGITLGFKHDLGPRNALEPYLRLALGREFNDRNTIQINGADFDNNLAGYQRSVGVGAGMGLLEDLRVDARFDVVKTRRVDHDRGGSFSLVYSF